MAQFKDIKIYNNPNYCIDVHWTEVIFNFERYKERYNLDINPEFQRGYVWTLQQKIAYIEYIITGGASGKYIYFNHPAWQGKGMSTMPMTLVDGKQRLTTVVAFMNNEIPIFGDNFYKDYTDYLPSHCELKFAVNNLRTDKEVVEWYLAMNTGGSIHTEEDLKPAYNMLKNIK